MQGVTILSVHSCNAYTHGSIFVYLIFLAVGIFITWRLYHLTKSENVLSFCCIAIVFSVFIATTIIGIDMQTKWTEYCVTVSDEVLFNEFYNKYEIIKTDGSILRVKER